MISCIQLLTVSTNTVNWRTKEASAGSPITFRSSRPHVLAQCNTLSLQ